MEKLTHLELIELSKINLRRTLNEIQDSASSILLLNLQWKDMENVLDSAQSSIEERFKKVNSKEEEMKERANKLEKEIERRENLIKDQFEELRIKEEELRRQCKDFELEKKCYTESLRDIELKQKQVEELQQKEEEFGFKVKCFEKRCRDFELEKKDLEQHRKDVEFSAKQCEQQFKEVKSMEKLVKDKLEEVVLKKRDLEKCFSEYELKEEQFGLKEKSFGRRYKEFELEEKALEECRRDLEAKVKQCEQEYKKVKVTEKWVHKQLEEVKRKEDDFGLKEKDFKQRCRDVELSEICLKKTLKDLEFKSNQCEERFRELELKEKLIKDKFEELKEKEEQLGLKMNNFEQCSRDFTMKEKSLERGHQDLEAKQKHYEECFREIKLKEKQIEKSYEELAKQNKDLEAKQEHYEECLREIKLKEKQIEKSYEELAKQNKDLEFNVLQYDHRFMELKLKEELVKYQFEQIESKAEQLRLKERHFEQRSKDFELKEKCLEQRYQELEAKEKHYDECLRNVKQREKEIEELSEEHRRKYEQQSNDLELKVKKCEQRFIDLESKEKKLAEWSKELESRRRLCSALHPQVKTEAEGSFSVKFSIDHSSPAHLRFCVNMDGKDLQMFLNERWKEHGSIGPEIAMALQLSADPAKLVLDAMEGFYPPHLSKGNSEFEGNAVRRSCILLLEQLMKLSPEIKPRVRKEAMKLAFHWITKMKVERGHTLEVLGFLQLLASFRLADAFDADELFNLSVFVAQHIQTPELFKVLGLGDRITGFTRKLVEGKQHMEAIRFIYAFEQVTEFPPIPVLKDFLKHSKAEARKIVTKGKKSPEARNEANTKRIADVRAVVKCIEDHKLESQCQPHNLKNLNNLIVSLEKTNASRSLTSPDANPALCTAPEIPSKQHVSIKRPREFIATEIAGCASLSAAMSVSSAKMPLKHLKGSKQDKKIDWKLPLIYLGERMEESNSKQLQQQDGEKKSNAATRAPAVASPVYPASAAPSSTAPAIISTPEQLENGSKRPRTALSQMHNNLTGFPLRDLHTNPDRKPVTDYYSWEALARPGDQS